MEIKQKIEELQKVFREEYGLEVKISVTSFFNDKETANKACDLIQKEFGETEYFYRHQLEGESESLSCHYLERKFEFSVHYDKEEKVNA